MLHEQCKGYRPTHKKMGIDKFLLISGDGCVDKPLSTLWRNHISSDKPDIIMKVI